MPTQHDLQNDSAELSYKASFTGFEMEPTWCTAVCSAMQAATERDADISVGSSGRVFVHRALARAASPVLDTLLGDRWAQCKEGGSILPGMSECAAKSLVAFIYTGKCEVERSAASTPLVVAELVSASHFLMQAKLGNTALRALEGVVHGADAAGWVQQLLEAPESVGGGRALDVLRQHVVCRADELLVRGRFDSCSAETFDWFLSQCAADGLPAAGFAVRAAEARRSGGRTAAEGPAEGPAEGGASTRVLQLAVGARAVKRLGASALGGIAALCADGSTHRVSPSGLAWSCAPPTNGCVVHDVAFVGGQLLVASDEGLLVWRGEVAHVLLRGQACLSVDGSELGLGCVSDDTLLLSPGTEHTTWVVAELGAVPVSVAVGARAVFALVDMGFGLRVLPMRARAGPLAIAATLLRWSALQASPPHALGEVWAATPSGELSCFGRDAAGTLQRLALVHFCSDHNVALRPPLLAHFAVLGSGDRVVVAGREGVPSTLRVPCKLQSAPEHAELRVAGALSVRWPIAALCAFRAERHTLLVAKGGGELFRFCAVRRTLRFAGAAPASSLRGGRVRQIALSSADGRLFVAVSLPGNLGTAVVRTTWGHSTLQHGEGAHFHTSSARTLVLATSGTSVCVASDGAVTEYCERTLRPLRRFGIAATALSGAALGSDAGFCALGPGGVLRLFGSAAPWVGGGHADTQVSSMCSAPPSLGTCAVLSSSEQDTPGLLLWGEDGSRCAVAVAVPLHQPQLARSGTRVVAACGGWLYVLRPVDA